MLEGDDAAVLAERRPPEERRGGAAGEEGEGAGAEPRRAPLAQRREQHDRRRERDVERPAREGPARERRRGAAGALPADPRAGARAWARPSEGPGREEHHRQRLRDVVVGPAEAGGEHRLRQKRGGHPRREGDAARPCGRAGPAARDAAREIHRRPHHEEPEEHREQRGGDVRAVARAEPSRGAGKGRAEQVEAVRPGTGGAVRPVHARVEGRQVRKALDGVPDAEEVIGGIAVEERDRLPVPGSLEVHDPRPGGGREREGERGRRVEGSAPPGRPRGARRARAGTPPRRPARSPPRWRRRRTPGCRGRWRDRGRCPAPAPSS